MSFVFYVRSQSAVEAIVTQLPEDEMGAISRLSIDYMVQNLRAASDGTLAEDESTSAQCPVLFYQAWQLLQVRDSLFTESLKKEVERFSRHLRHAAEEKARGEYTGESNCPNLFDMEVATQAVVDDDRYTRENHQLQLQIENGVSELELLRLELEGLETTLNEKYLLNAEICSLAECAEAATNQTVLYIRAHDGRCLEEKEGTPILSQTLDKMSPSHQFTLSEDGKEGWVISSRTKKELGIQRDIASSALVLHEASDIINEISADLGFVHNKFNLVEAGNGKFYVEMGNKQMAESSSGTLALSGNKGEAEQWSFIAM